jgi:hypothetical protein
MTTRDLLLRQLDLGFNVRSWHGANLMGALRGVTPEEAVWRAQPDRHNIAELVVHAAYWKSRLCRLVTTEDLPPFDLPGSDFFERSTVPTPAEWKADLTLLRGWHTRLRALVEECPVRRLAQKTGSAGFTVTDVILGAAAHDLYHAGQIQLLRRMMEPTR